MGFLDKIFKKDNGNDNIPDEKDPTVFISYSSYDRKVADDVCSFLESHNVKCFILPRDRKKGMDIIDQFSDVFRKVEVVLLIFSRHSNESSRVRDQINMAFGGYQSIISFKIDESKPSDNMEYYLNTSYWIEAYPDPENHLNELLKLISKLTGGEDITGLEKIEVEKTDIEPVHDKPIIKEIPDEPNTPSKPFKAYTGDKPFIFISYAHKDAERVFSEIKKFHDKGYPIWYDQGLTPGQEWDEEIAQSLMKSGLLVVFISENSMASKNVHDEIKMALNEDIDIVPIYLEETELTPALKLRLSNKHAIFKYLANESDYLSECFKAFDNAGIPSNDNQN